MVTPGCFWRALLSDICKSLYNFRSKKIKMKSEKRFRVMLVVGARPNFMKIDPVIRAINRFNSLNQVQIEKTLVHTGQHYDFNMSEIFFKDLNITEPDIYIGVGSGTHGEQTGRILIEFEKLCLEQKPDLVVVVGDVNSTVACALCSAKLHIPVAHVESGLRSFDRKMPEEINRIVTDVLSDFLFTTCEDANKNLEKEGIDRSKIFLVGNVMIDSLLYYKDRALKNDVLKRLGLIDPDNRLSVQDYAVLTLHRPSNVDDRKYLERILKTLEQVGKKLPIVFPVHPRTMRQIKNFGMTKKQPATTSGLKPVTGITCIEPLGYLQFINLMASAKFVLTDSGGIQEETTALGVPCFTLRDSTERPVTIEKGTNTLIGNNPEGILKEAEKVVSGKGKKGEDIPYWDGKAAERIISIIAEHFGIISQ